MGIVAPTDDSRAKGLIALSNAADGTFVQLWADPVTHRLLVDNVGSNGTVTSVSVVSANGFAGTVATATTTPAITLSTTITGVLSGNGTAISAATTTGSGSVVLATAPTITGATLTTTSVNGVTLTTGGGTTTFLNANGAYSTPSASAASITVGTTTVLTGTSTRVLFDNAGVLGEYTISGTGSVAMTTSPVFVTPTLGAASGTSLNLSGLTASSAVATDGSKNLVSVTNTGTGNNVLATSPTLTSPVVGTQATTDNSTLAASTAYVTTAVSNAIAGVNPAVAVQAATTQASDTSGLTYNNGASGIGATFTGTTNTALTVDGFTFTTLGQRLLVKNDTQTPSGAFNGVYNVTQVQTAILPPILTRALDYDTPSDMNNTGAIPVVNGTANANTSWLLTSTVVTVGTTPLTYVQFSLAPSSIVTLTGTQTLTNKTISGAAISGAFTGTGAYIPVTLLNSGTSASSSTFWRGDGTWATPAGSGTVNSGTSGQMAYYASSTNAVSGNANVTISSGALTLGVSGSTQGSLLLSGGTTGALTIATNTGTTGTLTLNVQTGGFTILGGTVAGRTLTVTNNTTLATSSISYGSGAVISVPTVTDTVAVLGTAQTFTAIQTIPQVLFADNAIAAVSNAATVTRSNRNNVVTNSSAAGITITLSTSGATAGDMLVVQSLPSSAVAQTITWVNTENSDITPSANLNASTTSPRTDGFKWNPLTSKWRCIASA